MINAFRGDRALLRWQKKGVGKGENVPPYTEGSFSPSVFLPLIFCLYFFSFLGVIRGANTTEESAFSASVVFVLYFLNLLSLLFLGVIRGAKPPLLIIAVYRIETTLLAILSISFRGLAK